MMTDLLLDDSDKRVQDVMQAVAVMKAHSSIVQDFHFLVTSNTDANVSGASRRNR